MKPQKLNQSWTSADERKLKAEARGNTPTRIIALHLQRTEDGIRAKAQELGVSLKPTNQRPYGTHKRK